MREETGRRMYVVLTTLVIIVACADSTAEVVTAPALGLTAYCNYPCTAALNCSAAEFHLVPCDRTVTGDMTFLWPHISGDGQLINGGTPQLGNLSLHLDAVRRHVGLRVPDANFSGNIMLDFELWTPTWILTGETYQNFSIELVIEADPSLKHNRTAAVAKAKLEWEASSLHWYVETIKTVREIRPQALVGYWGYPTTQDPGNPWQGPMDDRLAPLWQASSALFPAMYMDLCEGPVASCNVTTDPTPNFVRWELATFKYVLAESLRVSKTFTRSAATPNGIPVLPVTWAVFSGREKALTADDVWRVLEVVWQPPAVTSVVQWGYSWPINVAAMQHITGPVLAEAVTTSRACSLSECGGHGWCSLIRPKSSDAVACMCEAGWSGPSCSTNEMDE